MNKIPALAILALCHWTATAQTGTGAEPVRYMGGVSIDLTAPDGKLRPAIGVENRQVFRSNRSHPEMADGFGWTYNHAPMLAYWNGKFYLEYLSNPLGEQIAPGHSLLVTSEDGRNWSKPAEVFPIYYLPNHNPAIMHQRMGFYVAPDGRLLVLGFYGQDPNPFNMGGIGRVVREISKDGTFGPIYFIRYNRHAGWNESNTSLPYYKLATDKGFVTACDALLANKLMTLQWWQEDQSPDDFYTVKGNLQALSFFHRPDGKTVALWKFSLSALSADEGRSWTTPVKLPTITMSGAKIWGQKTADGRFAIVYNPVNDSMRRYPLAIATGDDGIRFNDLLYVGADLPPRRFAGRKKDFGLQYVRGIEEGNGTPPGKNLWLTYSVNKEDIWVARVPLPVRYAVTEPIHDTFDSVPAGGDIPNWNIYSPAWAPVRIAEFPSTTNKSLELENREPYDYARAVRVFQESKKTSLTFKVLAKQADSGRLDIDVTDRFGSRPIRLAFLSDGKLQAVDGSQEKTLETYQSNMWYTFDLTLDTTNDHYSITVNGRPALRDALFAESVLSVERISFRTGAYRLNPARSIDPETIHRDLPQPDEPSNTAIYYIDDVTQQSAKSHESR